MIRLASMAILASLALASPLVLAGEPRRTAVEKYGIGGHVQSIGIHHGFHVETVAPDSPASEDRIRPRDVILKVDGESIRSLEHLRAVFAEAYMEDGRVSITYMREDSISPHTLECHLKPGEVKPVGKKRRPRDDSDEDRR